MQSKRVWARVLGVERGVVIERDGLSVLGIGEAAALPLPDGLTDPQALRAVTALLAKIGPAAMAIGTFHFLPDAGVALSIPAVAVHAPDGAPPVAVVVTAPIALTVSCNETRKASFAAQCGEVL